MAQISMQLPQDILNSMKRHYGANIYIYIYFLKHHIVIYNSEILDSS